MRKKIVAVLLCIVFMLSGVPIFANDLRDLRDQADEAAQYVEDQKAELAVTRAAIDQIYQELRVLDERMLDATDDLLNIYQALYATIEALEQAEQGVAAAQDELERQHEAIRARLRAVQVQGSMGLLSVVFQATSLRDFLMRIEHVNSVARQDHETIIRLEASEGRLAQMKDAYARQHDSVVVLQLRQQAYVAYLVELEEEREAYFRALLEDEYRAEAMLIFYQEQAAYIEAVWQAAYEAEQRRQEEERIARERAREEARRVAIANLQGELAWPVPSSGSISSPFGPRVHPITRRNHHHSGIDIRATSGSNIVAAEAGRVILSGWHGGYGYTVIIDHGNGMHTLYGHNSRNLVRVGDTVHRYQVIALIGSTGFSTGPHLHFEVRIEGRAVNPGPFLGL